MSQSPDDFATTRFDLRHEPATEPAITMPVRRRRTRSEPAAAATVQVSNSANVEVPCFAVEPSADVPDIVVRHADDIALHLAQRLREVEQRELAAIEFEARLQEAEAAARVWVCQRDMELSALERELQLRSDEVTTQSAAVAAAQIAAEQEIASQHDALRQREAELERLSSELTEREERLHGERSALDQAMERFRADRRREEELQRSRQQKWQALIDSDRAQAERTLVNLQKHRQALDERERNLTAREQAAQTSWSAGKLGRQESSDDISLSVLRAEAARDHRLALEQRWIAGQLWSRLAGSGLAGDDELQDALEQVRRQLEMLYRRERAALEELQSALAETVRQALPARRELNTYQPRTLAFTG